MSLDDDAAWRPPAPPSTPSPASAASGVEILPGYDEAVEIARGGDSIVYRARQRALGRDVAVKVVLVTDATTLARFERELDITARLGRQHPNIVTVIDTGVTAQGQPAIVMDLIERGSTHDVLVASGPFPVADVVRVGTVIADALSFAHSQGVLHRDVKPQNILVLPTSYVLTDFGISRLADSGHTASVERFSYRHAAPQVLDGENPSVADDIWSLGSTLHTLLDGRAPFASDDPSDDSALQYLRRARTEEPRALQRADVPDSLREVIARCLRKEPHERFASAEELHRALVLVEADIRTWAAPASTPSAFPTPDAAHSAPVVHAPYAPAEQPEPVTPDASDVAPALHSGTPTGDPIPDTAGPVESSDPMRAVSESASHAEEFADPTASPLSTDPAKVSTLDERSAWGLPTTAPESDEGPTPPAGAAVADSLPTTGPAPERPVVSRPSPAASGPKNEPQLPSKSALAHAGTRGTGGPPRTPDADPTGLAPSGHVPDTDTDEASTNDAPAEEGRRNSSTRRVLAGLLLGVGIGAAITLVQLKGRDQPVQTPPATGVATGPGVPTTSLPSTGVTAVVPVSDPRIAPVLTDVKPNGTSVDLTWTDRSGGKALFVVTQTNLDKPVPLKSFRAGVTSGTVDLPDPTAPRVCLVIAATTGPANGVSNERCFDPTP